MLKYAITLQIFNLFLKKKNGRFLSQNLRFSKVHSNFEQPQVFNTKKKKKKKKKKMSAIKTFL